MIYAVDFDGTLCVNEFPNIGQPIQPVIDFIKKRQKLGDNIILWTCRSGAELYAAMRWCDAHGLFFDAVNDNLSTNVATYQNNSRKVNADYYIDDRNIDLTKLIAATLTMGMEIDSC